VEAALGDLEVLRLLQLGSAALPIGAFAYSQGLEQAVTNGAVRDAESAGKWVEGLIEHALLSQDLPIFARLHAAWSRGDREAAERWSIELYAARGSRELREEELQLGKALARWLSGLGYREAEPYLKAEIVTLASIYALAAERFRIALRPAALAYAFSWTEAQIGAATRLIPLGQADAQRALTRALAVLAKGIDGALARADDEIGSSTQGQVLFSMLHETQYSRLFRS
jgi:urease accessory protein